jgi:uncharacterized membrane protein (UPF0127 family)
VGFLSLEQPLLHMAYALETTFLSPIVDPGNQPIKARIVVNRFEILADVAITDEDQIKGLSIKDQMNENEGMLFVYDKPSRQSFWMKDMRFPIDWLNGTGSVSPNENAQYVLETVASRLERLHGTTSILSRQTSRQLTRSMSSHKLSRYRIHFATLLFEEYDSYLRQNLFLVLYLF